MHIGLIGLGRHGRHVVTTAIHRCEQATLAAVADADPGARAGAADLGVPTFATAEAMMDQAQLDAVYIATLAPSHADLAIAAMRRGLHVICEKPMAESVDACRAMQAVAEATGCHLVVNFENRFCEHIQQLRRWVRAGRLGEVQAIHLTNQWDGHKSFGPIAERRRRLMDVAGALDCGIHKLDLARFLTGGGRWQRVTAAGAWFGERFAYPPHLAVLGTLAGGVVATINASLTYAAHIAPRPMLDLLSIAGTRGVASYCVHADSPQDYAHTQEELRLYTDEGIERIALDHQGHVLHITRLLEVFGPVVRGERSLDWGLEQGLPTGEDGLQAQIATEWAHADALQHRSAAWPDTAPVLT